jgi:hypothetical protein
LDNVKDAQGAWMGITMDSSNGNFLLVNGSIAQYAPVDFFSRLVADFDVCLSMNYGHYFDEDAGEYIETVIWDENFCRRHKMPLCMVDFADEVSCVLLGDSITSDVIEQSCDGFSRCIEGNYTEVMCEGGMRFSVNGSEFGGGCIDAREVPECDIDECMMMNATCPEHSVNCTNEIGTHVCECGEGFRFNDSMTYWDFTLWTCDDIDECIEETDDCNDDSTCVNTYGSFWCECHGGFYYDSFAEDAQCVDFDECLDGVHYYETQWPPQLRVIP